ncbi:hypothetical protein L2E82_44900 [Cichorium intybus]|uniref:Uncharacterized protein n=1 Tax=Cichorium intybus TaxID=13427 RepID=A0ACB8ZSU3_CICIN|nr:hypothetical protein L2E82_44900 [Cichorium intybus]
MAGFRLHVISPLVLVAARKCARDPFVYVRKCAANALPKVHDLRLEENAKAIVEVGLWLAKWWELILAGRFEEGEYEYENAGFIVDDVDEDEQDAEEEDSVNSDDGRQKKRRRKKRKSEKNYVLDEEDYELLEDNNVTGFRRPNVMSSLLLSSLHDPCASSAVSKKFKRLKKAKSDADEGQSGFCDVEEYNRRGKGGQSEEKLERSLSCDDEVPPGDEWWLCPACDCKIDCVELLYDSTGSYLSINDTYDKDFPETATFGNNLNDILGLLSDDYEDYDYTLDGPGVEENGVDVEDPSFDVSDGSDSDFSSAYDESNGSRMLKLNPIAMLFQTFEESLIAAGASLSLVDSVLLASKIRKNPPFGFALIRPPGHHAVPKGPMGFCVKMVAFKSF